MSWINLLSNNARGKLNISCWKSTDLIEALSFVLSPLTFTSRPIWPFDSPRNESLKFKYVLGDLIASVYWYYKTFQI